MLRGLIPFRRSLKLRFRRWAAGNPRRASFYYWVTGAFQYENYAVLNGVIAQSVGHGELAKRARRFRLRQWIHGLEKGLTMRPRKNVFALKYITEAVDLFDESTQDGIGSSEGDLLLNEWAYDVLHQYFTAVSNERKIQVAREKFTQITQRLGNKPWQARPYRRDTTPLSVSYDDLLELAKRRRSVRWYLQKVVPRDMVDKAIRVAAYSPSACNRQPFEFRVYDDPTLVTKIADIPMGTSGFSGQMQCIVVVIGHLTAFHYERDRHLIYIDASLAAIAFQFALEVQGLSSCVLNWPEIPEKEKKLTDLLSLTPDERPVLLISLGYPDPERLIPYSQKKSLNEIRSYNKI